MGQLHDSLHSCRRTIFFGRVSDVYFLTFIIFPRAFQVALKSESESLSAVSDSLRPRGLLCPWNSPGQNTGVGSLSLLQGIFPTQEWNLGLLHCRWSLYQLSYQGSPKGDNGKKKKKKICLPMQEMPETWVQSLCREVPLE